ncbi:ROK family protein [Novosphingobium taihuense]|uniref:fructokinase n=1 Tax=Novosphingobium taihuense TaxID=260085 RepID=A0A7W7AB74_9SPHN|nr:ROK family protein [Novosphingobium taihuense]MBB4613783.1 fructokinase [Novosphingobium taihuense]TWH83292.1 fructokinase [Novosphingobium taihuense]
MSKNGLIGAVEAGGTKFVLALATHEGEILARTRMPTNTPVETWPAMRTFFDEASTKHGPIAAFGVASFGPIDIDSASNTYGMFTTTPKAGWSGARFHDALSAFGAPIKVDTDVNGAAIGEWMAGAGQGCRTLAYTTIGTGVGTGVVREGCSLMGISHFESGHIVPPRNPTRDPFVGICPYHGDCIEGLACGPAIERRWGRSLDQLGSDEVAIVADYIAHLASTLVLLHMPDRLIFGGGVMKAPGLIEAVRRATAAKLNGYVQHPRLDAGLESYIVTPGLGDDAGITGAIELGRQALASK